MYTEEGLQLSDLKGVLRRRWATFSIVAGSIFLLSLVLAALLPDEYQAAATLLVEPQTVSKNLVDSGVEETDLNERLHLMQMEILSRRKLSRVIDDLGLYAAESKEMTREDVIELMRDHIDVVPVLPQLAVETKDVEINTFQIVYGSHDRQAAAKVANRLANDFIDEHIRERVQVSGDTSDFIDSELERISTRIETVESRIRAIKSENAGRLPEDVVSNQRRLEHVSDLIREAQGEVAAARSDEAFYRQQAATGSDQARAYGRPDSPAERLQRLELALAEYESRGFTDKHPDVVALREEMAIVEDQIRDSATQLENDDGQGDLSPAQLLAKNEADRASLRAAAAEAEVARLSEQAEAIRGQLAVTPRVAEQLSLLAGERDHLSDSYREYSAKRLEASVAADMERRQKGQQFRLLDPAVPPPKASSPNRPLILVMGLLVGLMLGGGLAVGLEAVDSSFHEPRMVRVRTGFPVLATVPGILFESDRAAARRRRLLGVVLAVGISGAVLIGAGAGYWWVNGGKGEPAAEAPAAAAGAEG
jgi:succinoglycan biosynthesis transport protein ExoP